MKKAFVLMLVLASVLLLAACGNKSDENDKKDTNGKDAVTTSPAATSPTSDPTPIEEIDIEALINQGIKEEEEADEQFAEEVRHIIEVGASDVDQFFELEDFLSGKTDAVEIFVLTDKGLEALYTCPSMQSFIKDVYGNKLNDGNLFQSTKYEYQKYIITAKSLSADGAALLIEGHWDAGSAEEAYREELDEDAAEEVRHCIEIALAAEIETYEEIIGALAGATDSVDLFVLSDNGLEYLKDLPNMKKSLESVYNDQLYKGNLFKSQKYKQKKFVITVKALTPDGGALQIDGHWN